ncbi:hypothetical protein GCM10012319_00270 [Comamonas sp. KCTC 72670]|nr:hypothetical protein GCM10012319_00270 [Comamonas sp. KCTC 72670]
MNQQRAKGDTIHMPARRLALVGAGGVNDGELTRWGARGWHQDGLLAGCDARLDLGAFLRLEAMDGKARPTQAEHEDSRAERSSKRDHGI